jgi:putative hydrolase of the HAD superfamily
MNLMHKKAIIFDLDNTIYSVRSIGKELFASLFELIIQDGSHAENMEKIKEEIMRRPFQLVASDYNFSGELTQKGIELLKDSTCQGKIEPFSDYEFARNLPVDKFLVTTGFLKLQQSKVEGMKIGQDFKEIHIVDPLTSDKTKKDVFADIMKRHSYSKLELLVVGDDLYSEIKAAQELGIDGVLYDKFHLHDNNTSLRKISDFKQLESFLFSIPSSQ